MNEVHIKGNVRLYACGGTAINIAKLINKHDAKTTPGFANIETGFIDTSRSNLLAAEVAAEQVYLVEGLDGSGGLRKENAAKILDRKLDVLQRFKPSDDLNIVLSSGGGGSGSVIAPTIVQELVNRELPVIVIMVGSVETHNDANNTLKTLMTYDNIADKKGIPVVIFYVQNDPTNSHAANDKAVISMISVLRSLFSRENDGLDRKDLQNWLRFDKIVGHASNRLASLSLVDKNSDLGSGADVISVATLALDHDFPALPFIPEYQCKGFIQNNTGVRPMENLPLHFLISDGFLADRVGKIEAALNDRDDRAAARVRKGNMFSRPGDQGNYGDLVL